MKASRVIQGATQTPLCCEPLVAGETDCGSVEDLCAELIDHMLDCDVCLDAAADLACLANDSSSCSTYQSLRETLARQGGIRTGQVFAA